MFIKYINSDAPDHPRLLNLVYCREFFMGKYFCKKNVKMNGNSWWISVLAEKIISENFAFGARKRKSLRYSRLCLLV